LHDSKVFKFAQHLHQAMQTPHSIPLALPAYPHKRNSVLFPAPTPCLQNSRNTFPIVAKFKYCNTLLLPGAAEHTSSPADANVGIEAEMMTECKVWRKEWYGAKSERFVEVFINLLQA
jgi:hypothetical protein